MQRSPIRDHAAAGMRLIGAVLFMSLAACRAPVATTVLLVRHAERPPGTDPDLNDIGRVRAESLSTLLANYAVDAIIHTQYRRTQQTAAPLARRTGLTPIVVPATGTEGDHARAVISQLDALKGRTVIYVGHSNTVPVILAQLGIAPVQAIADNEYGSVFLVRRVGGRSDVVRLRY
ncbi:MAG: SixA phosphatase family protein [Gemmatimonadota bacterium]